MKVSESDFGFTMRQNMQFIAKYIQQYRLFLNWETDDIYFQYNFLLHGFRYQFYWNLLNHAELIVKCESLFENII